MDCLAYEPGDMDFCLQCGNYFECEWKDAVLSLPVLEADLIHFTNED